MKLLNQTLFIVFFLSIGVIQAQDFSWWDTKHNWDGVSPRTDLIIMSPAFMGPNALPVPTIQNGRIPERFYFEVSGEGHFSKGDNTKGMHTALFTPLFSDRVGLHLNWVPVEFFEMDTVTRDIRRAMDRDGKGKNMADLYFSTYIQLLKDHAHLPDILATINLRTATGNKLSAARTTDAPGYFFDLSFGKTYQINQSMFQSIRPYAMFGFYVWQIDHKKFRQNDAFLFGLGYDIQVSKLVFKNALGGYAGYIGNGDNPLVLRASLQTKFNAPINYHCRFQKGLYDFEYTSFQIGLRWTP
jgi:hypothetical protein